MRTYWGEIEVNDAHVHFFSPVFFESLSKQKGVPSAGALLGWDVPQSSEELADSWTGELDANGVARAALIASIPADAGSVASAVARHPERFHGFFMVNPAAPGADRQVASALASGMQGICLFPAMHRYSLHSDRAREIVQLAASNPGTAVFVHCGVPTVGFRKKLGLPSLFDMRFSNPVDLHPIALEYPHINFIVPHFGAGYFREALMLCDLCPNVFLDTSSSNSWVKYEAADLTLRQVFRKALDVATPNRLLFGSDSSFFPRGWVHPVFEQQSQALQDLGVNEESARAIFGGNFRKLLVRRH